MSYTIGEMAKKLNVAPSTLRYYDKEGLLPFVERSNGGIRVFKESDFGWLAIIHCLKKTGMSIKDIKKYMDMAAKGDSTIDERLQMFQDQRENVLKQIEELNGTLKILDYKCWYYETAKNVGTTEILDNMKLEDMPDEYAMTRASMEILNK